MKKIGILGLQGAVQDHERHIRRCGGTPIIVKNEEELAAVDALILPGGESTVMSRFLRVFDLTEKIKRRHHQGMPIWGICAGSILLAADVDGQRGELGLLDITINRNAYGRHHASFEHPVMVSVFRGNVDGIFIRAPKIINIGKSVDVLAYSGNDPVFVRQNSLLATTFHPELTHDSSIHSYFMAMIQ